MVAMIELSLPKGFTRFGDPQIRPQTECAPEEVEKVILVADYDSKVTLGEIILDHGVSRVSVGTFLGFMVARDQREALGNTVVVFEHPVMRDAHLVRAGQSLFPVEEPIASSKLADLVRHLVPSATVVVCDKDQPVGEVMAHYPRVAPGADLVRFGLVPQS